ncbi:hypothetical protein MSAN_01141800 [Mycena sanguinolenta]|uniref:Uncharacterized protein n=1 Tax=Mycena sanguinolenta TaxID=230812 RepID=A0A8H6YM04_9AGAR|nr:hypothetical protein MSAN_01141800 [Mycena sanguinolenta]
MASSKRTKSSSKENPRPPQSRKKAPKKSSQTALLQDHNIGTTSSGSQDGVDRIRELEALLCETQGRLRTTEARLAERGDAAQGSVIHHNGGQATRIPAPSRISDVTMSEIRSELGYTKQQWNAVRSCVRDCLSAARLDWDAHWKSQSTTKLGYAFNAVEDDFPELRRFDGQWAVNRIAKDVWDNRKTYIHCVDKPSTYIGRRTAQRHAGDGSAHTGSQRSTPPDGPASLRSTSAHGSPQHTPSPGPSRPAPRPLRRPRAPSSSSSSSSDDDDDLEKVDDTDDEEEEETDEAGRSKKRTKASGGLPAKRQKILTTS